jgi:hypothetical protein
VFEDVESDGLRKSQRRRYAPICLPGTTHARLGWRTRSTPRAFYIRDDAERGKANRPRGSRWRDPFSGAPASAASYLGVRPDWRLSGRMAWLENGPNIHGGIAALQDEHPKSPLRQKADGGREQAVAYCGGLQQGREASMSPVWTRGPKQPSVRFLQSTSGSRPRPKSATLTTIPRTKTRTAAAVAGMVVLTWARTLTRYKNRWRLQDKQCKTKVYWPHDRWESRDPRRAAQCRQYPA